MSTDNLNGVISIFEFIKNNIESDAASETVKNDYETFKSFVAQYPAWLDLAIKYKKNPGSLLELFSKLGNEVLSRSNDLLINEISDNLKNFVSVKQIKLSDNAINSLDNLITFIKANNIKK